MIISELLTEDEKQLLFAIVDTNVPEHLRKKIYFDLELTPVDVSLTIDLFDDFVCNLEEISFDDDEILNSKIFDDATLAICKLTEVE